MTRLQCRTCGGRGWVPTTTDDPDACGECARRATDGLLGALRARFPGDAHTVAGPFPTRPEEVR